MYVFLVMYGIAEGATQADTKFNKISYFGIFRSMKEAIRVVDDKTQDWKTIEGYSNVYCYAPIHNNSIYFKIRITYDIGIKGEFCEVHKVPMDMMLDCPIMQM